MDKKSKEKEKKMFRIKSINKKNEHKKDKTREINMLYKRKTEKNYHRNKEKEKTALQGERKQKICRPEWNP